MILSSNLKSAYKVNPELFFEEAYTELLAIYYTEFQKLRCEELRIPVIEDIVEKIAIDAARGQAKEILDES